MSVSQEPVSAENGDAADGAAATDADMSHGHWFAPWETNYNSGWG